MLCKYTNCCFPTILACDFTWSPACPFSDRFITLRASFGDKMEEVKAIPGFYNLDDLEVCAKVEEAVSKGTTWNFAVEFDSEKAYAALDLKEDILQRYLMVERAPKQSTRWINIFAPDRQPLLVKQIAQRYNFSPRLTGIMCSKQHTPKAVGIQDTTSPSLPNGQPKTNRKKRKSTESRSSDLEMHKTATTLTHEAPALDLSHYKLVDEVWHYCSVDWDPRRKEPSQHDGFFS